MSFLKIAVVIVLILLVYYYYAIYIPSQACNSYTPTSTGVSTECLAKTWKDSGCTTALPLGKAVEWWQKQTYQEDINDINAWSTVKSDHHRETCYGADKTAWPA